MNKFEHISKQEVAQAYNQDFASSTHLRDVDALYRWVLGKLNPRESTRLLDVACGLGVLVNYARSYHLTAHGVDLSLTATLLAKNEAPGVSLCVGDGEGLPYADESFDYATNIGSLEHFLNMKMGLSEMQRVLKKNGTAAILLPNSYYLLDIFWKVWRTGYSINHHQIVERFATYNEWKDLLEDNGFHVQRGYKYNHLLPRTVGDLKWYWLHPKRIVLALVGPFIPKNLSYHFLYVCKKAV